MMHVYKLSFKRTVLRSTKPWRTRQENTPRVRRAFVDINKRGECCLARSPPSPPLAPAPLKFLHIFGKGAGARGGDGGERGQEKNQKICVTMLVDIKLYVYCNS